MADLILRLTDVYGEPLGEKVDIRLQHHTLSGPRIVRAVASANLRVRDLIGPPQGLYSLFVDPPSYLPVALFVRLTKDVTRETIVFPVDPVKVKAVTFPPFTALAPWKQNLLRRSESLLNFAGSSGAELYERLDTPRKAGLLNICAKCDVTFLGDGKTVADYLVGDPVELVEVLGDRVYVVVPKELLSAARNAAATGVLQEVPGGLHHPPREGFVLDRSFKSDDRYGNLQLTFFSNGSDYIADIDIDDAGGLAHLFQVARNTLTGRPTHPFDIHQILLRHQKVDPAYRFVFA